MPNQTITQYINSLTPSTLSLKNKPYTQSTIDKYKTVVRNAFKSQNVDIDTINWEDTDTTSKLIDKITPNKLYTFTVRNTYCMETRLNLLLFNGRAV